MHWVMTKRLLSARSGEYSRDGNALREAQAVGIGLQGFATKV
jgi:hypothetical protein